MRKLKERGTESVRGVLQCSTPLELSFSKIPSGDSTHTDLAAFYCLLGKHYSHHHPTPFTGLAQLKSSISRFYMCSKALDWDRSTVEKTRSFPWWVQRLWRDRHGNKWLLHKPSITRDYTLRQCAALWAIHSSTVFSSPLSPAGWRTPIELAVFCFSCFYHWTLPNNQLEKIGVTGYEIRQLGSNPSSTTHCVFKSEKNHPLAYIPMRRKWTWV